MTGETYIVYRYRKDIVLTEDYVERWKAAGYRYCEKRLCFHKKLMKSFLLFFVESYGRQKIKLLYDNKGIAHSSYVIPYCAKFSFMGRHDYQIGPCNTREDCRGKSLYPSMLNQIGREIIESKPDSNVYVLIRERNLSSNKGIQKANFEAVGTIRKTSFLKHYKKCIWKE